MERVAQRGPPTSETEAELPPVAAGGLPGAVLDLQRRVGNAAVMRVLARSPLLGAMTAAGAAAAVGGRTPLADAELEAAVAASGSFAVEAIAAQLAEIETRAAAAGRDRTEEIGEERDDVVARIRNAREQVDGLTGADAAFQARFHRALNRAAPAYWQSKNIDILELEDTTKTRTCNITALGMALEGLGRTPADYDGDLATIDAIAAVYAPKVKGGRHRVGDEVTGLRMPDFLELAAIAQKLGAKKPTEKNIRAAAGRAWKSILSIDFLGVLAGRFGVSAAVRYFSFSGVASDESTRDVWKISSVGKQHRSATEKLVDDRLERERLGKDPRKSKVPTGGAIEKKVPLEAYRTAAIAMLGAELDAGHQIVASITRHYLRLESVAEDHVMVDDPAQSHRANRRVTWEEARAMGYFKYWLSLSR